ncbi:MAG: ABC transporter ATP-binding protein [Selenomonadaceae bacterium]|nr:ABC transporter ATP-binding protein [Selenomonadaceae bacterium]
MNKIRLESVSLSFGRRELFKNLTLEFSAGKVVGVIGRNGSGKSTLLKLAAKILKPDTGEVNIHGAQTVAAVTPEMKIYDALTAAENLNFFAKLRGKNINPAELGRRVGVDFETEIRAGDFSTGMRQRLKFAILLAVDADVWILDEPTSNLDEAGREIFLREIKSGARGGKIILLATNDAADLEVCDEVIELPAGGGDFS